jgi:hypothetical protein
MPEAQLSRVSWEVLDRLAYGVMDARLWLFELMHGPERPTPADEIRGAQRNGAKELPVIECGAFVATVDGPQNT